VYLACLIKALTEYSEMRNPVRRSPKLNIGATSLLTECPKSLNAFIHQLKEGERSNDNPKKVKATITAETPRNAEASPLIKTTNLNTKRKRGKKSSFTEFSCRP